MMRTMGKLFRMLRWSLVFYLNEIGLYEFDLSWSSTKIKLKNELTVVSDTAIRLTVVFPLYMTLLQTSVKYLAFSKSEWSDMSMESIMK